MTEPSESAMRAATGIISKVIGAVFAAQAGEENPYEGKKKEIAQIIEDRTGVAALVEALEAIATGFVEEWEMANVAKVALAKHKGENR